MLYIICFLTLQYFNLRFISPLDYNKSVLEFLKDKKDLFTRGYTDVGNTLDHEEFKGAMIFNCIMDWWIFILIIINIISLIL